MDLADYFGPTKIIAEGELSSGEYPRWVGKLIGNLGKLCAITIGHKIHHYAIYLGFAEDNHDYYYRIYTSRNENEYWEILESAVSGIKFVDINEVSTEDINEVKSLLANWENDRSHYKVV